MRHLGNYKPHRLEIPHPDHQRRHYLPTLPLRNLHLRRPHVDDRTASRCGHPAGRSWIFQTKIRERRHQNMASRRRLLPHTCPGAPCPGTQCVLQLYRHPRQPDIERQLLRPVHRRYHRPNGDHPIQAVLPLFTPPAVALDLPRLPHHLLPLGHHPPVAMGADGIHSSQRCRHRLRCRNYRPCGLRVHLQKAIPQICSTGNSLSASPCTFLGNCACRCSAMP